MMIETKNKIFIHLQKCGGTYISYLMKKYANGKEKGSKHDTINKANKELIGCIRNPLEWYVSLWAYGCGKNGHFYNFIAKNHPDKLYLYNDSMNINNFEIWLRFILSIGEWNNRNIGLLTFRFFNLYNNSDWSFIKNPHANVKISRFIRNESIEQDFKRIFGRNVKKRTDIWKSSHLDYQLYYDDALIKLVRSKDEYIFKKFGY